MHRFMLLHFKFRFDVTKLVCEKFRLFFFCEFTHRLVASDLTIQRPKVPSIFARSHGSQIHYHSIITNSLKRRSILSTRHKISTLMIEILIIMQIMSQDYSNKTDK